MKSKYLFPHKFKLIGWILFIPSTIIGLYTLLMEYEPSFFDMKVPALFIDELFGDNQRLAGWIENNTLNEILSILFIAGGLMVAFSKEKIEDEYISEIRLSSLVWAVYFNFAILILAFLLVYGFSFLWVMQFNMFTILLFFIIRFHYRLYRLK